MHNRYQRPVNGRTAVLGATNEAKRIAKLYENTELLEALADRRQPLPPNLNLEQMLRDLSAIYLGMADHRYPFN